MLVFLRCWEVTVSKKSGSFGEGNRTKSRNHFKRKVPILQSFILVQGTALYEHNISLIKTMFFIQWGYHYMVGMPTTYSSKRPLRRLLRRLSRRLIMLFISVFVMIIYINTW